MKIDRLIAAFAFVLAMAVSPALAQPRTAAPAPVQSTANVPESKIALIYSDAFLDPKTGINRFTTLITNLNREFQPRQTELQSLQGKIQALTDDVAKTASMAEPKTIALKQEQLDQLKKDISVRVKTLRLRITKNAPKCFRLFKMTLVRPLKLMRSPTISMS